MGTIALPSVAATQRNIPHKSSRATYGMYDMLRTSMYDDAVCVNAAVEINVIDYNVAVHQRTATYVNVRRRM